MQVLHDLAFTTFLCQSKTWKCLETPAGRRRDACLHYHFTPYPAFAEFTNRLLHNQRKSLKLRVQTQMNKHFTEHVIGVHLRTGNGEGQNPKNDFAQKHRGTQIDMLVKMHSFLCGHRYDQQNQSHQMDQAGRKCNSFAKRMGR